MRSRLWALSSKDPVRCCLNSCGNNACHIDSTTQVDGGSNYSGPPVSSASADFSSKSSNPSTASSVGGKYTGTNGVGQRGSTG